MTYDTPLLLSANTPISVSFSLAVEFSKFDITGSIHFRHPGPPELDSPPLKTPSRVTFMKILNWAYSILYPISVLVDLIQHLNQVHLSIIFLDDQFLVNLLDVHLDENRNFILS